MNAYYHCYYEYMVKFLSVIFPHDLSHDHDMP